MQHIVRQLVHRCLIAVSSVASGCVRYFDEGIVTDARATDGNHKARGAVAVQVRELMQSARPYPTTLRGSWRCSPDAVARESSLALDTWTYRETRHPHAVALLPFLLRRTSMTHPCAIASLGPSLRIPAVCCCCWVADAVPRLHRVDRASQGFGKRADGLAHIAHCLRHRRHRAASLKLLHRAKCLVLDQFAPPRNCAEATGARHPLRVIEHGALHANGEYRFRAAAIGAAQNGDIGVIPPDGDLHMPPGARATDRRVHAHPAVGRHVRFRPCVRCRTFLHTPQVAADVARGQARRRDRAR